MSSGRECASRCRPIARKYTLSCSNHVSQPRDEADDGPNKSKNMKAALAMQINLHLSSGKGDPLPSRSAITHSLALGSRTSSVANADASWPYSYSR